MPLLLVEDNQLLASSLARGLGEDGFEVRIVATGAEALQRLAHGDIELVVLDLGLPDMDGLEVIDFMQQRQLMAPILVVTARDQVNAKIEALDRGADDFIVKPFEYAELLARVKALVRRAAAPRWAPLACNGLVYRSESLLVTQGTEQIALSKREHEVLGILLRRQNEAVSRDELRALIMRDPDVMRGSNVLNVYVTNLRRKLGSRCVVIEPVRTIGYRLRPAK